MFLIYIYFPSRSIWGRFYGSSGIFYPLIVQWCIHISINIMLRIVQSGCLLFAFDNGEGSAFCYRSCVRVQDDSKSCRRIWTEFSRSMLLAHSKTTRFSTSLQGRTRVPWRVGFL